MKGQIGIGSLGDISIEFVVAAIIIAMGATILAGMLTNLSDGNATAVINAALTAIASFANWFSILVTIVIAVIVLSFVYLIRRAKGGKK